MPSSRLRNCAGWEILRFIDAKEFYLADPVNTLAAVDLGSNSFHMVVARYTHGQLVILESTTYPGTTEEFVGKARAVFEKSLAMNPKDDRGWIELGSAGFTR